ncbi:MULTISPECIES: RNA polymerase sigma factor [Pedobacter]|uniref:RNA polymerase sigma factor n=1 Tax=Pedobacter TaxID=84567 RepID=UPI0017CD21BD|nr:MULTISPECIES: RNA polymerase sigma-70 factor [Pedobacter]NII82162.1 RNA polymerase sigma-70 factor (ECF subfamily) [Pedobacter sp. SG908]NMN36180.1 RNA polymerase sigma-70 factor (ECF subfamily) [Pedobacter sp. SG918]
MIKIGDQAAFAEVYERYWTMLFLHARNLLRQNEEAADIVQELFTGLWLKCRSLELNTSLSFYLYKAVRNKVFDHLKHKKVMNDYLKSINDFMLEEHFTSDHLLRERELGIIIENEINALPSKMRDVFVLSRKQHLSYQQIAIELKISEHTVKSQISNALRILRKKVGASSFLIFYLIHR